MSALSFRELTVWQKSMELAKKVYALGKQLPAEEKYGLVGQMQRSAVSIPSNIAEGNKRGTARDYVQFIRIASGSAAELETQLLLVKDIYRIDIAEVLDLTNQVQKMLQVMGSRLLKPTT